MTFLKARIEIIKQALYDLFVILSANSLYQEYHKEGEDFFKFTQRLKAEFRNFIEIEQYPLPEYLLSAYRAPLEPPTLETLKSLSSPAYKAPVDTGEVFQHLNSLLSYWGNYKVLLRDPSISVSPAWDSFIKDLSLKPKPISEEGLDLALTKLILRGGEKVTFYMVSGQREKSRTQKSTATIKAKAGRRKSFILAIYDHGDEIPPKTTFSKVYRILKRQFEKSKGVKDAPWGGIHQDMQFPTRDTIMTLFTDEGIIERDFIMKGKFWITNT